jgi:hypothetical protein
MVDRTKADMVARLIMARELYARELQSFVEGGGRWDDIPSSDGEHWLLRNDVQEVYSITPPDRIKGGRGHEPLPDASPRVGA